MRFPGGGLSRAGKDRLTEGKDLATRSVRDIASAQHGVPILISLSGERRKLRRGGDMKAYIVVAASLLLSIMAVNPASAQGVFKVEKGEAFNKVVPKDFVLEGSAIPIERRNSSLVIAPSGARMIVGVLDTTGYSSQVQEKYLGMLIAEGSVDVCGNQVAIGSYGFGLAKQRGAAEGHAAKFILYNQAGEKVAECAARWDARIRSPRPLEVVTKSGVTARLYLGRNWVELK